MQPAETSSTLFATGELSFRIQRGLILTYPTGETTIHSTGLTQFQTPAACLAIFTTHSTAPMAAALARRTHAIGQASIVQL